jgi:hypothetical protein|tara:strand:+ start:8386 stop:9171 length:786 start_codon:yes stop_codon:yes gene_type:complete
MNKITVKELSEKIVAWGWGDDLEINYLDVICDKMNNLSWPSTLPEEYRFLYSYESFISKGYLDHYDGDLADKVILDIGGSIGDFSLSIMDHAPKKVYIIEPMLEELRCILLNLKDFNNVKIIPAFIGDNDDKFKRIVKDWNISNVDFMKCDCEGGERDIFTKENLKWITSNVKFMTGEYHIVQEHFKDKMNESTIRNIDAFKKFRDLYFNYPGMEVIIKDRQGSDITQSVYTDKGISQFVNWNKNTMRGQYMFTLINHNLN